VSSRVLITGGAGFFGELLAQRLLTEGYAVRSLDVNSLDHGDTARHMEQHIGDVRDPHAVARAVEGCEVVVHNAALVPVTRAGREFHEVNVGGTRTVLEGARRAEVRHAVHISSSAVYGTTSRLPITESAPAAPIEAYGRSKAEGDAVARELAAAGLPVTIMRPRTLVGPGRLGLFELVFDWIATNRPVFILGSGHNRYQLLAASDFAEACALAVRRAPGGEFNIGSVDYATPREDLGAVIAHAGSRSVIRSVPPLLARSVLHPLYLMRLSPLVPWHYMTQHHPFYFATERARDELGFEASISNREMLVDAFDRQRERPGATGSSPHQRALARGVLGLLRGRGQ
jgi:nucleoside-diphosphate-sugar epimerase